MKKITLLMGAMFVAAGMNAQYCIPEINCSDGDNILNVEFAGISNPSDCTAGGYTDFTTLPPAEVEAGQTYSMSVEVGAGWSAETVALWIDFDQSETFEATESYLLGTGSASVVTGDIEIPAGVENGTYRMRISVVAAPDPILDPCLIEPSNFGEFEDYLVEVNTLSVNNNSINGFSHIYSSQDKSLTISSNDVFSDITLFNIVGQQVISKQLSSNNEVIDMSSLKNGVYVGAVTANGKKATFKLIKR